VGKWWAIGAFVLALALSVSAGAADARIKPLPVPSGGKLEVPFAVSCLDANDCWFAGLYEKTKVLNNLHAIGLAVRETKAGLKPYVLPRPVGAAGWLLDSVSCWAADACRGAGFFTDPGGHTHALLARWDGHQWTDHAAPAAPGVSQDYLARVTCSRDGICLAVGATLDAKTGPHALAVRSNASSWRVLQVPSPSGAQNSSLSGVSCVRLGNLCEVTGTWTDGLGISHSLAELWFGGAWKLQQTTDPVGSVNAALNGVACFSGSDCVSAGGWFDRQGETHQMAETWNGHAWTLSHLPTPPGGGSSSLSDVSCFAANRCVAFGYSSPGPHHVSTLAERWNGLSWSIVPTANQSDPLGSGFADGVCLPGGACVAAGGSGKMGGGGNAFLETFQVK
jgi:Protein of unknown function (DUF2510)